MPRGFLVKRQKSSNAFSYRARHNSEEDRSDSGSEPENFYASTQAFGSPDSGYCHSPISLNFKDAGARYLATTYPDVKTVTAGSTGRGRVPELVPARKEVSEEEMQPMDYSTSVTAKTTTTTNNVDNRPTSQGRSSAGPLQDVNDNTGRSHAVPRHPAEHRSTLEETVSNRYPGVDLTRGFNLNADLYSQVKYHHPLLQYPGGPAFTNSRFPMPPLAAPPGAAQEEVMMDTGRPESTCSSSPRSSPAPSVGTPTHTQQGSPFYFSNFDRLSVSSPGGPGSKNPASSTANKPGSAPGTPGSPGKKRGASTQNGTGESKPKTPKKGKAVRKIKFELEDKSSPVSGTFIRDVNDMTDSSGGTVVCGDIDSAFNLVEVTPEARQELERIENKIGDYVCQLCKEFYTDAFQLAQHKCSRIVHIEYRCPECDKLFNCPANLASHRRWHKPRPANNNNTNKGSSNSNNSNNNNNNNNKNNNSITVDMSSSTKTMEETVLSGQTMVESTGGLSRKTPSPGVESNEGLFECEQCGKKFRRQAYLRKHVASHADEQPFPCQFCGKVLRSETARAKHVLQHAIGGAPLGAKDFPCGVCAAIFPSRPALERHARLHTSEVYPCKYCSNTFYSSPGLTRHINKCHPSENRQVILLQMPVNRPC